jgi:hypothetical protein
MTVAKTPHSKILNLRLALVNYPILADKIRKKMRQELFKKGIIDPDLLEEEVQLKAIRSQIREGLSDPVRQEAAEVWHKRLRRIRDYLTDFYFAYNLPYQRFEEIVTEAVNANRAAEQPKKINLTFNPELTPWYLLFEQAEKYETFPPELYDEVKHHLRQIIVVLIKSLVSTQMEFVHIARNFLNVYDLKTIKGKKIGPGKVGGKAAGMILAYKILTSPDEHDTIDLTPYVHIPDTYYVGSDVYYDYKARNQLEFTTSQKYRSRAQIEEDYPTLKKAYLAGTFPEDIVKRLHKLLEEIGNSPIIVRSSSLLEDNFGYAFAGKYESYFLANQGTADENLRELLEAITRVYASVISPDALFYRQVQELEDYDERMAILIQKVQGEQHGQYFFPLVAGVGFSRNPFIWNKKLRPEDGFLRIVLGLGTRAVDRVDRDYPRMIGLSHPQLRPVKSAREVVKYSQRSIDVIDLKENTTVTLAATEVLSNDLPGLQYLVSLDEGDYVKPVFSLGKRLDPNRMVLTFDNMLKNTDFVKIMKSILTKLERHYERPVDVEFTVELFPKYPEPELRICLLQCRPLSNQLWFADIQVPQNVPEEDEIFYSTHLVPQGIVERVRYIIYVDPNKYSQIPNSVRMELARIIGKLNQLLEKDNFILIGPGRWGSSNIDLGVRVSYADIYNAKMLIEVALARNGATPEVSYGTHFFQDLVESNIFPLALYPGTSETRFNQQFLDGVPNKLAKLVPEYSVYDSEIKVIDLPEVSHGKHLRVAMSAEVSQALGYLTEY